MAKTVNVTLSTGKTQVRVPAAPKPAKVKAGPPKCRCSHCQEEVLKASTVAISPDQRVCKEHEGAEEKGRIYTAVKAKFPAHKQYDDSLCWVCGVNNGRFILDAPTDQDFRERKVKGIMQPVVNTCDLVKMCPACIKNMNMQDAFTHKYPSLDFVEILNRK